MLPGPVRLSNKNWIVLTDKVYAHRNEDIVNMATNRGNNRQMVSLGDITNTSGQG
jgi:predicted phosphodiesterase